MVRVSSHLSFGGVLLGLVVAGPAMAQGLDMSHGQQVNVTALGGFDWDQNAQTVTAYDQAQAIRGDVTVRADRLIAYYRKKTPTTATVATGQAATPRPGPPGADAPLSAHLGIAPPVETRRPHIVDDPTQPANTQASPAPTAAGTQPAAPAAATAGGAGDVDTSLATATDVLPQDLPTPDGPAPAGAPGGDKGAASAGGPPSDGGDGGGASEVYRLEAIGHVHAFNTNDQAWGDHAVYDMDQAVLVMTGAHLKMTSPQDILTARDVLEYHSREHMSVARGNATMTTNDGRQMRADVLVGYDKPKDQRTHPGRDHTGSQPGNANGAPDASQPAGTAATANDRPAPGAGTMDHMNAFGHIVIRTRMETVTGDRGVYVPDTGIARLVGDVHITRGENQVSGTAAIVNMHTDIATLTDSPGSRVSGLIIPNQAGKGDKGSAR
ncbi:hypothetical protein [Komagataeibacter sp. SM21]|uniref:hypothetical protein n=1 Tax=Komagataeibacter sp. SM21 TaxID=3242899 RepID=UPI0035286F87